MPKKLLVFFLGFLLLSSLLNQTLLASDFDRAKTTVASWPQLAKSHLVFSLALFKTGSLDYQKELILAKNSLFWNEKKFAQQLKILNQPQLLNEVLKQWQALLDQGIESPEIYLNLSLIYYQFYQNQTAQKLWEKAFYLDPNSQLVNTVGKIIKQASS